MIRRITMLLLIAGCEEPAIEGCTDSNANNYNITKLIKKIVNV